MAKPETAIYGSRLDEPGRGALALQLHFFYGSESMGDHDWEVMDGWSIDRGDAGALGVVAAEC